MTDQLSLVVAAMTFSELEDRREDIQKRLQQISIEEPVKKKTPKRPRPKGSDAASPTPPTTVAEVPGVPFDAKTDTHWDFLMKEMMWLAADFQGERKRQHGLAKKAANGMKQFHKTKETRRVRQLAEAELKRRRLAGKLGREVRGWWTKIERVISYKQKLSADQERRKSMNQQLVELVRLTEKYGETVTNQVDGESPALTIEEALSSADRLRQKQPRDYARLELADEELYGESTTSESGSDGSFVVDSDEGEDDETTLQEAEVEEIRERRKTRKSSYVSESFAADPDELLKLQEESRMKIDDVLERLQDEGGDASIENVPKPPNEDDPSETKRVTFAKDLKRPTISRRRAAQADPGHDADDDGDISDVEDFIDSQLSDGSDEFETDGNEVDDETTIDAEERLGREMSAEEEINLLEKEGELSIEELRKMYAAMEESNQAEQKEDDTADDMSAKMPAQENLKMPAKTPDVVDVFEEDDAGEEDEFKPIATGEVDDETTLDAEERLGREMSPDQELTMLQQENEIPVEQLRAMYAQMAAAEDEGSDLGQEDEVVNDQNYKEDATLGKLLDNGEEDIEDFVPEKLEVDDETTMEAEERLGRDMSYQDEIDLLKREGEMSVEELRKLYAAPPIENGGDNVSDDAIDNLSNQYDGEDGEEAFEPEGEAVDDETTMELEERLGREMSVEAEISLLKRENEMSVEELRAMYTKDDSSEDSSTEKMTGSSAIVSDRKKRRVESEGDEQDDALEVLRESEDRARTTTATRPYLLSNWVKLREYQQTGLNWLVSIQTRRLNGILADEMGLGKTLQTISLLSYLAAYKGIWGPHIVIVPTSVILNWETELKRFCPALKVLCYYGPAKRRKELRTGWTKANWYHVVITSYQLAVQDAFAFKRKKWYYMILDEAHNIKNFQSQRWQTLISFNSQRRLLITGTPLQNNLTELWSLLHFLMPHVFRSRKEFSYWFSNPMNNIIEGNSKRSDDLISRLHGIIRPFVLRRLKKDVETQLPGKYEHLVKCQMSRRQMFLYEEFMARSSTRTALKKGGNFMGMMNVLMQLRKVCNHPDLFEPRAVITPFAMNGIDLSVPELVVGCLEDQSDLWRTVSDFVRVPIWCGSTGLVSPSQCLDHDSLISHQLTKLATPDQAFKDSVQSTDIDEPLAENGMDSKLTRHLKEVWEEAKLEKYALKVSQSYINQRRCQSNSFCFPGRVQNLVTLEAAPLYRNDADVVVKGGIVSTPRQLIALRKSSQARGEDAEDAIKKFVFCIPKAGASATRMGVEKKGDRITTNLNKMLLEPLEQYLLPFQKARARLSSFFPDKRLVQFDAGKLQTLAGLLHNLKRGGHRVLIFTQMSKMLDVLETFLNLNGHTYLRLDGSTGVEKRQRLMDKFNNDEKVFCFILSTRSGGLGINLTGADTVIFYDSDWNPAMDAQAQDRAHRIGQTRDVHIYRLLTEHSIEENIWTKAKQKRNLDLIVMDEGKFDANNDEEPEEKTDTLKDMYSKGGLRDILGLKDGEQGDKDIAATQEQVQAGMSSAELEKAMASLEDADDAAAMETAKKEAEDDLKEFDETVEYNQETEEETKTDKIKSASASETDDPLDKTTTDDDDEKKDENKKEEDMVKEFNAWQNKVGMDASSIEESLSLTEKYGLDFRENVDPFWSIFAIMEERRRIEAEEDDDDDVDIDAIELENAREEQMALEDGDLLGTNPPPDELPRQRHVYQREKSRLRASKKRRKLTGENWVERVDGLTKHPFWYNEDTGEAIWEKPTVLIELEVEQIANEKKWNAMPLKSLFLIMSYLIPFPERMTCSQVCRQWKAAATDFRFVLHVLPVELGATHSSRKLPNHFGTIADAMKVAQPGDTIELGDGHYWVNTPGLVIDFPVKFVGDEHDPLRVVIELTGCVRWNARGGFIEGITFRRPKIATLSHDEILAISTGKLDIVHCVLDNECSNGNVASVQNAACNWFDVLLKGSRSKSGLFADKRASIHLDSCQIRQNKNDGILCTGASHVRLTNCQVDQNGGFGLLLREGSKGELIKNRFADNDKGILERGTGSTCVPCSGNEAFIGSKSQRAVAGFRLIRESFSR